MAWLALPAVAGATRNDSTGATDARRVMCQNPRHTRPPGNADVIADLRHFIEWMLLAIAALMPIVNPMMTIQTWVSDNCPPGWLTGP